MKYEAKLIAVLAAMACATGCTQSMRSSSMQPNTMAVSVQFVVPSQQQLAYMNAQSKAALASDTTQSGFSAQQQVNSATDWSPNVQHVALWGGPHNGTDVTVGPTALPPGSYTFAFFDQPNKNVMQGWVDVQKSESNLVGMLSQWKDSLSQQKERLAYEYAIDGRTEASDPKVFNTFKKQMSAFDKLERRVQNMLNAELKDEQVQQNQITDLLAHSDVLIMPGDETFFRPTTEPTFSDYELDAVRNGDTITKLVMAANYKDSQWKLQAVQELYGDLMRFKEVLTQEADRLERQKGLYLLTDHLYHHDKKFVENEMRLQHTLGIIDRCDERATELRERRLGLAFVTALFSPDKSLESFDTEENNLRRERIVLQSDLKRIDTLTDQTDQSSVKRVALERNRQRVMAMIDSLNNQMDEVDQARMTMMAMASSTNVIHRENDMRLLTTTLVSDDIPYNLLQNIKQQALMSIRLEATDKVYVPRPYPVTSTMPVSSPVTAYRANAEPSNSSMNVAVQHSEPSESTMVQYAQRQTTHTVQNDNDQHQWSSQPAQKSMQQPQHDFAQHHANAVQQTTAQPMQKTVQQPQHKYAQTQANTKRHYSTQRTQQPMQRHAQTMPAHKNSTTHQKSTSLASQRDQSAVQQHSNQECPWYVKLLVPPCWLISMENQKNASANSSHPASMKLTGQKAKPTARSNNTNSDCPLWAKLFVPPCWLAHSSHSNTVTQNSTPSRRAKLTGQSNNVRSKECTCWLAKLLVPKCWFFNSQNDHQVAQHKSSSNNMKLTGQSAKTNDKGCTCWLAKLLVPPCWLSGSNHNNGQVASKAPASRSAKLTSQSQKNEMQNDNECNWLVKLLAPPCWLSKNK